MEQLKASVETFFAQQTWEGIDSIIDLLSTQTQRNGLLDPFVSPDTLLWNGVGVRLMQSGMRLEALTVFHAFLDRVYCLQEEQDQRIHKGTPFQYLGLVYRELGQIEQARKYHILAFIEDAINNRGRTQVGIIKSPASIVLHRTYRMREKELDSIQSFVLGKPLDQKLMYPEELFLDWITENEKTQGLLIARSKEESLFKTNIYYLRKLIQESTNDRTGKSLELLAAYLFSCVDGFEPVPRKGTSAFHFDLIIRNLIKDHQLLKNLGDYIGVECKNLNTTVTAQQLNHFIQKLRLHSMKCGVIFTKKGISGIKYKGLAFGRSIQAKTWNRDGVVVFDITESDLEEIAHGLNLLSLLLRKYESIQFM
jgi:hypothetical protein